jgi:hypothetical protein
MRFIKLIQEIQQSADGGSLLDIPLFLMVIISDGRFNDGVPLNISLFDGEQKYPMIT